MPIRIFFCYAHEDENLLMQLKNHLTSLHRQGLIEFWCDRDINAGAEWEQEITKQLNTAHLILLLISPDFMASDYCYGVELQQVLARYRRGEVQAIPIILRPTHWQGVLGEIQVLPTDAKPILSSSWRYPDEAFFNVVEGVRKRVEELTPLIQGDSAKFLGAIKSEYESFSLLATLEGHENDVSSLALSRDGHTLFTGSWDTTIKVWDLSTGNLFRTLEGKHGYVWAVAVNSSGQTLVSGHAHGFIQIWKPSTGELVRTIRGHKGSVYSLAISPDNLVLVSGSHDTTIKVWYLLTGRLHHTLKGHTDAVRCVSISADGQLLVSGGYDKTIKVWDLSTGQLLRTLEGHVDRINTVALSPNKQILISGSKDATIKVWDLRTGQVLQTLEGYGYGIMSLLVSYAGNVMISGGYDQTVKIWDLGTRQLLRILEGHTKAVFSVAMSANEQLIISGSNDRTIKVWGRDGMDQSTVVGISQRRLPALSFHPLTIKGYSDIPEMLLERIKRNISSGAGAVIVRANRKQVGEEYHLIPNKAKILRSGSRNWQELVSPSTVRSALVRQHLEGVYAAIFEDLAPIDFLLWRGFLGSDLNDAVRRRGITVHSGCIEEVIFDEDEYMHSVTNDPCTGLDHIAVSTLRSNTMKLTGQQYQQLTEAILDAFPTLARLAEMVQFRLEKNLYALALGDDLKEIVVKLIRTAEAEGWTNYLIVAARKSNPGNPALLACSQQFGLAPGSPFRPELERIIKTTNSFLDVDKWRTKLGQIEAQVCRIEILSNRGMIYGTGFLLAPDVIITNYHVMEAVIEGEQGRSTNRGISALPRDVVLRFDYKRQADGTTLNPGTIYHLATENWLVDKSPMSPIDRIPDPKSSSPEPDQLDYALLRVAGIPGNDAIGDNAEPGAPSRKWIEIPTQVPHIHPNTALFILQHPQGDPLQLALETDAIIGTNANNTRVSYRTNTLPGSSGSPCFNSNWELVALHHSGDPNFDSTHKPVYNEGIPFSAILDLLEQRGLKEILGEQKL